MHGAQEPAELDVVIQKLQAVPRIARRRRIDQRKQNACHDLEHENDRCCAPKHIPPAGGIGWDLVFCCLNNNRTQSKPLFKPVIYRNAALL